MGSGVVVDSGVVVGFMVVVVVVGVVCLTIAIKRKTRLEHFIYNQTIVMAVIYVYCVRL